MASSFERVPRRIVRGVELGTATHRAAYRLVQTPIAYDYLFKRIAKLDESDSP